MNQRLERLHQLLQIKVNATEEFYHHLLKIKEEFSQNKSRHEQLVVYRQEYIQQLETIGHNGSHIGRLRNRIDFINHLDTALVQLNTHLSQLAKMRTRAELNYKQAKTAEEGVKKLIERVQKGEMVKLQRKEQKESDEYAQKQWYSKNINDQSKLFGD
ncbi:MAG: flagellar export protein FliJ [Legionella sp.]|nr:MAG: flagellar export protein FliJ [Legionella sp.]